KGSNIFLGRGESSSDRSLMAHELVHVVQQTKKIDNYSQNNSITRSKNKTNKENRVKMKSDSSYLQRYALDTSEVNWGKYGGSWGYFLKTHVLIGKRKQSWPYFDKKSYSLNFNNLEPSSSGDIYVGGGLGASEFYKVKQYPGKWSRRFRMWWRKKKYTKSNEASLRFYLKFSFRINNKGETNIIGGKVISQKPNVPKNFPWSLFFVIGADPNEAKIMMGMSQSYNFNNISTKQKSHAGGFQVKIPKLKDIFGSGYTYTRGSTSGTSTGFSASQPPDMKTLSIKVNAKKVKPPPPPPQKVSDYHKIGPILYKTGSTSVVKRKESLTPTEVIRRINTIIPRPEWDKKEEMQKYKIEVVGFASDCVNDPTKKLEINKRVAHARAKTLHDMLVGMYGRSNVLPLRSMANIGAEPGKCSIYDQKVLVNIKTRPRSVEEYRP
ncbi:MAG: DUF4157 domain-containing protein, partial [Nitrosopumilus sp.]|nr:DUF4157 domain-containing protein [Nitrosopumilus sp.]